MKVIVQRNFQDSTSKVAHLWTCIIDVALDAALPVVTNLTARAVILVMAAVGTETNLVALARTIAGNHSLGAVDQRVAVVIRGATALCHVIDHATTSALSTCLTILARTCKMISSSEQLKIDQMRVESKASSRLHSLLH
jgi:hypothetical protein